MSKNLIKVGMFVKLALSRKTVAEKIVQGNTIGSMMTGNTYFTTPPSLVTFATVVTALSDAAIAAENGGKVQKDALDTAEALYDVAVSQMALYVQGIADSDPLNAVEIIHSAGMDTRKTPEKRPIPGAVTVIQAIYTGQPDTVLVKWKRSLFTVSFELFVSNNPSDPESWRFVSSTTKNKLTATGLAAGTRHYFRLISVGTAGRSVPSAVVSQFTSPANELIGKGE